MAINVNVTETVVNTDVTNTDITVALTEQTTNVELTYPGPQGASAIVNVTTPITNTGTTTEPNIGIDQTLLSLTRTQIVGTAVTEAAGKALTAGTADYATLAGTSSFSTNAGTSVFATTAGGAPPTGNAGGDLTGTYPNPTIAAGVIVTTDFNSAVYSATNPAALGSATAGTAATIARTDHVHPTTGLAVLASANTFTDQQTITPATSVTALVVNAASSAVGLIVKLGASGSANLQEWQNNGGTALAWVGSGGSIVSNNGSVSGVQGVRAGTSVNLATLTVIPTAVGTVGSIIRGLASQTADLTQWQDSGAAVRASVSSAGAFTISPSSGTALTVNGASGASASVGLIVKANTGGGGGDIQQWFDTGGVKQTYILSGGNVYSDVQAYFPQISNRSTGNNSNVQLLVGGTKVATAVAANVALTVQNTNASPTGDLFQYQTSSGTVLGGRNALAQIYSGSTAPVTVATGGAISGTSSGTTATLTSASAHGLAVGDLVTIASMTPSGYNGTYLVQTVPTTTTFTVTTSGSNLGNSTVSGTASVPAQASITARSAGTVGLVVRAAASQVAKALSIQNSSGTQNGSWQSDGGLLFSYAQTNSGYTQLADESSGGVLRLQRLTASATSPGANLAKIYLVAGTNANTLKLVVRAGAAGAETTILDNIPT